MELYGHADPSRSKINVKDFFNRVDISNETILVLPNAGKHPFSRTNEVDKCSHNPSLKTGRFLWMDEQARREYVASLHKKIANGYFSSDHIISKIVDDMAPVFNDYLDPDTENPV